MYSRKRERGTLFVHVDPEVLQALSPPMVLIWKEIGTGNKCCWIKKIWKFSKNETYFGGLLSPFLKFYSFLHSRRLHYVCVCNIHIHSNISLVADVLRSRVSLVFWFFGESRVALSLRVCLYIYCMRFLTKRCGLSRSLLLSFAPLSLL